MHAASVGLVEINGTRQYPPSSLPLVRHMAEHFHAPSGLRTVAGEPSFGAPPRAKKRSQSVMG
jgi:hypothetical protein